MLCLRPAEKSAFSNSPSTMESVASAPFSLFSASRTSKFGLREVDVGKTEIQLRLQLALKQSLYLISNRLPCAHGLLSDGQHVMRLQRAVEGLIHR